MSDGRHVAAPGAGARMTARRSIPESIMVTILVHGVPVVAELPPETLATLRAELGAAEVPGKTAALEPRYISPARAAELLGYPAGRRGLRRVYALVGDGRLTRHGPGRRLLLDRAEVERLASGALTPR